jgi:hypothetical protein
MEERVIITLAAGKRIQSSYHDSYPGRKYHTRHAHMIVDFLMQVPGDEFYDVVVIVHYGEREVDFTTRRFSYPAELGTGQSGVRQLVHRYLTLNPVIITDH